MTMMKKKQPQPHDLLFAEVFSRKEVAASFIKNFAGTDIPLDRLKLETLRLEPTSYVKPELKRFYSDLVFSCLYGEKKVEISIIQEHKSTQPVDPHFQLYDYIGEKWRQEKKQKKKRTPVICILLFHGKQNWSYKPMRAFIEGMDDQLSKFNPLFDFILVNLANYPDDFILQLETLFLVNALLMFKHSGDTNYFRHNIGKVFIHAERFERQDGGEKFIETILVYLTKTTELSSNEIITLASKIPKLKDTVMKRYTLLELELEERVEERTKKAVKEARKIALQEGRQEGRQEGHQEGRQEGRQEGVSQKEFILIKRGWERGLTPEFIADFGDMPIEKVVNQMAELEAEKEKPKISVKNETRKKKSD